MHGYRYSYLNAKGTHKLCLKMSTFIFFHTQPLVTKEATYKCQSISGSSFSLSISSNLMCRRHLSTSCTKLSLLRSLIYTFSFQHFQHFQNFQHFQPSNTLPLHEKHCNVTLLLISRTNWEKWRVGRAVPSFKVTSALHPLWLCQAE